tara:strand:+ start:371 stop:547 length:177 start_codon:yes stop_codon:yes gene_type:complete
MNTEQDLLTLIQTRNQRIAELELKILDLDRENKELKNARQNEEKKEVFGKKKEDEKAS